ncbi:hypothetical protein SUGI_0833750 [Cryptomeria japonica]|nr:hypothetical protein SUGI_0833750 [Cryptomeria japonica]
MDALDDTSKIAEIIDGNSSEEKDSPLHSTPPFRFGLVPSSDLGESSKMIDSSTIVGTLENMEIEKYCEDNANNDKATKCAIVPFQGDPNKDLVDKAMKEIGMRRTKRKKKSKKIKK